MDINSNTDENHPPTHTGFGQETGALLLLSLSRSSFVRVYKKAVSAELKVCYTVSLETSVAFIVCIWRKNEVFCDYSADSVGWCVLH